MFTWLLLGLTMGLIALHMRQSRFDKHELSSAQFFAHLTHAPPEESSLKIGNPLKSRPLYPQLIILILLITAVLSIEQTFAGGETQQIGLWLFIDTSASMTTQQNGTTRLTLAQEVGHTAIDTAVTADQTGTTCFKATAFNQQQTPLGQANSAEAAKTLLTTAVPQALGTDLSHVRTALTSLTEASNNDCIITHVVVLTDLPMPEWFVSTNELQLLWQDVSQPVSNVGFTNITANTNPLTGLVSQVNIEITRYGDNVNPTEIVVVGPDNLPISTETILWQTEQTWLHTFIPLNAGLYQLILTPPDAYGYDNTAVVMIPNIETITVDWQLTDRQLPTILNWQQTETQPNLRVTSIDNAPTDTTPTLLVGHGYDLVTTHQTEIEFFDETSPLLADLNFDSFEQLGLPALDATTLPSDFTPVLRNIEQDIWLAQRLSPPAAYVPGLPLFATSNGTTTAETANISQTLFFNAMRWLLQTQPPQLYTLTTPAAPEPEGNRIPLHPDEGNSSQQPLSFGDVTDITPIIATTPREPIWPIILFAALCLLLLERALTAYGGDQWH